MSDTDNGNVQTAAPTAEAGSEAESRSWVAIALRLGGRMAVPSFPSRDLAELRRLDPSRPALSGVYWRWLAEHGLLGSNEVERKWALALTGMALMTRSAAPDFASRFAHLKDTPVGRALYLGPDRTRAVAWHSEDRLMQLTRARGDAERQLLLRLFRSMGAAGVRCDWGTLARLIFASGYDEDQAEAVRRHIVRSYYGAESYAGATAGAGRSDGNGAGGGG